MNTLYGVNRNLERILFEIDEADSNGLPPDMTLIDQLKAAVDEEGEKIDACCVFIASAEAQIQAFKEHKAIVDREIKRYEKSIENLKAVAHLAMKARGLKELKGKHGHRFSIRRSKSVEIFDTLLLPDEYLQKKEVYTADKAKIKQDIELGKEVLGAKLVENENVQVK